MVKLEVGIMKFFLWLLAAALLLAPAAAIAQEPDASTLMSTSIVESGDKIAVVIAIEFYSTGWAWRPEAIKDANNVAWTLSTSGFDVNRVFGKQATKKGIVESIEDAAGKAGNEGSVLIYFSLHGIKSETDPDGKYMVPHGAIVGVDADLLKVEEIRQAAYEYVPQENVLLVVDTGSTYEAKDKEFGTIAEFATVLKQGLAGAADKDNNGKVAFVELADHIGPKVKDVKIEARPAEEIMISEQEITVISTKLPKKKRRGKNKQIRMRADQFDQVLERKMEEQMRKIEELDQKMQEIEQIMNKRGPMPFPIH
jgi:caspase domain-containing protein